MAKPPELSFEHAGLNVEDPCAMADWYCKHLGMRVMRKGAANGMHFLGDASGRVVFEVYRNPKIPVPDYRTVDPLILHLAFAVEDVKAARDRLCAAGATACGEIEKTGAGDEIAGLRDPWGVPVQFVKRKDPMLRV
jgi:catechol 2,3-dioxygenase-like lactoylglutathione lyase family enzyme